MLQSIKMSSMKWLVTYVLENDNHVESETICLLSIFKRIRKVYFKDGCLFCSHHHRQRYGIDCAYIFHVVSQAKELKESNTNILVYDNEMLIIKLLLYHLIINNLMHYL